MLQKYLSLNKKIIQPVYYSQNLKIPKTFSYILIRNYYINNIIKTFFVFNLNNYTKYDINKI